MPYHLKSTLEVVEIIPVPHTEQVPRYGRGRDNEFRRDTYAYVTLPPQAPGHSPRQQVVRWDSLYFQE